MEQEYLPTICCSCFTMFSSLHNLTLLSFYLLMLPTWTHLKTTDYFTEKNDIIFTYEVEWEKSDIIWASRWDTYLAMSDVQIHWFSIINSVVVVFFLSGRYICFSSPEHKVLKENFCSRPVSVVYPPSSTITLRAFYRPHI